MTNNDPLRLLQGEQIDRLRSLPDLAERLGCSVKQAERLWQTRQIPGFKIGKLVRFSESDIDRYIEAHRIEAVR